MKKINLVILDYDEAYLKRLNEYLSNKYVGKYEISCFTKKENMLQMINNIKSKDVLLINKDMSDDTIESIPFNVKLEFIEVNVDTTNEAKLVHKFKDINKINDKIIELYKETNSDDLIKINSNNADTKIISVYSPIGGSGKSSIAANLSIQLSEQGARVFYLCLEDIQSTNIYFNCNINKSFSDVIFEIKDRSESYIQKLLASINSDENTRVDFLNDTENILDIEDMNESDIKWLIEGIIETKKYHYIIVDLTSKYNSVYDFVLRSSNNIITPILDDKNSIKKIEKYILDVKNLNKYYFVFNKYQSINTNYNTERLEASGIEIKLAIMNYSEMIREESLVAINNPRFRNSILNVIKELDL